MNNSGKLSRSELRIIEQTKREGEELYRREKEAAEAACGKSNDSGKPVRGRALRFYLWFVLVFIAMTLIAMVAVSVLSR